MSRIGKKSILIPAGVQITIKSRTIFAKGPKGEGSVEVHPKVSFKFEDNQISLFITNDSDRLAKALWGTMRAIVFNLIEGVANGFTSKLELNGVGYKMALAGDKINFALGFSHPVEKQIPIGISITIDKNLITGQSFDKQALGQFMAEIFKLKPHEPYKGKGFKIPGKVYRRLAGKTGKTKK
jgi:large subunit ribosomal protein L6